MLSTFFQTQLAGWPAVLPMGRENSGNPTFSPEPKGQQECWWKKSGNQLRLVVYPIIYRVLYIPKWCRISCINRSSKEMKATTYFSKRPNFKKERFVFRLLDIQIPGEDRCLNPLTSPQARLLRVWNTDPHQVYAGFSMSRGTITFWGATLVLEWYSSIYTLQVVLKTTIYWKRFWSVNTALFSERFVLINK